MMFKLHGFRSFVLVGLAIIVLGGSAASGQDQNLWPFQVGNTWTVQTPVNGKVISQVVTVTKIEPGKEYSTATLETRAGTSPLQKESYRFNSKGISRVTSGVNGASTIYPGLPIVQYPLIVGSKWYWNGTITTKGKPVAAAAKMTLSGPEALNLQAGKFNAFKVHVDLVVMAGKSKVTIPNDYWFAPSVGLVRLSTTIGKTTFVSTLTQYKLHELLHIHKWAELHQKHA